jgi:hypothetical protein
MSRTEGPLQPDVTDSDSSAADALNPISIRTVPDVTNGARGRHENNYSKQR